MADELNAIQRARLARVAAREAEAAARDEALRQRTIAAVTAAREKEAARHLASAARWQAKAAAARIAKQPRPAQPPRTSPADGEV